MEKSYIEACDNCYYTITEPVCKECYLKELRLWLREKVMKDVLIKAIISQIKREFKQESPNETSCILCERENVSICMYCYFSKVKDILNRFNIPENLIEEFLELFNYPLYKDRSNTHRKEIRETQKII